MSANAALSGANVALSGEITAASSNNNNLSIMASGVLTLNDNINLGTGDLVINAMGGTTLVGVIELTAGSITHTGAITSANNNLTITAATVLNLAGNINTGTGNLTLDVGSIGGTFSGTRMLSGNVVTLNGAAGIVLGDGDLTISALGNLMVNTNISLGSGATTVLRLEAGRGMGQTGDISFSSNSVELRASRFFLTQNGAVFAATRPVVLLDGTSGDSLDFAASTLATRITYDGTGTQDGVNWATILLNTVSRGPGGTGDFEVAAADFVSGVLAAAVSITLDAGTGVLTFAATGDITLRAPAITITAGMIDLGADRTLTLTAETGALTLNFTAATTITGTVTGMGTAGLSVIAEDIAFSGTAPILNVPTVSLELTGAGNSFGSTAPFAANSDIGTLNITTNEPATALLEYRDWMAAMGRNLTITTTAGISIGSTAINLGMGNLTLNSQVGIVLTNAAGLTITVGDFMFFTNDGFLSSSVGIDVSHFVVMADGDITTTSINLGAVARVELLADNGSIIANLGSFGGRPVIRAGVLLMRQSVAFADGLINSNSSFVNRLELRITTAVAQPIHSWMQQIIRNEAGTSFSLAGEGVVLTSITTAAAADFGMTAVDLQATDITLGGDLTAGAVNLRADTITRGSANLAITATTGGITGNAPTLDSAVTTLTLTQNSAFGSSAPFTFGTALTLMLETAAAAQTVQGWMAAIGRDLNLTSTGGDITIGGNINVGTADLNLTASGNILPGNTLAVLTADTVSLELTGTGVFTSRLFAANSGITTLTITTAAPSTAPQQYRGWMAGTNRNLTITSATISINSTAINLGTGNLTFNSGFGIRLTNMAGLTITAGNVTFPVGGFIAAQGVDVSQLVVMASGDIVISDTRLPTARVELRADNGNITINPDTVGLPGIRVDFLLMRQMGMFADNFISSRNSDIRELILRTTTAVDQPIYDWMRGAIGDPNNNGTRDGTRFLLAGAGGAVLTSITTAAALDFGATRVDLRATTINLEGALTGGEVRLRTNTITGPGALAAIHATTGEIIATTITSNGRAGTGRPTLTNATSLSLEQTSAFGGRSRLPFIFDDAVIGTALTLSTRSEQLVRNWMIAPGRNLTITSSGRVLVEDPIGATVDNRDIGAGSLTLGSTGGGVVRIMADISTTGNLTLSSSGTGGINFNGGARILNGGTITLSGNARSNQDLSLSSGSNEITLGSTLTLTGDSIMFGNAVITGTANASLTLITTSSALTLNNNITLSGTGILDLRSGQGAITGMATLTLSATTTVRLRQAEVFGDTPPQFDLSGIGSLELVTTATVNQDVLNWMIEPNRNLTVTSARNVFVRSAIGASEMDRNLGTGNLTLISERRVRILADIATTGNIILTGVASSTQPAIRFENGARVVMGGSVRLNGSAGVLTSGGAVTLTATATDGILTLTGSVNTRFIDADGATTFGDLILTGATIQIARAASAPVNTRIVLRGRNITLTSAMGILIGRFNRVGDFLRNNDVASLTVNAQIALTIAADITAADDTRSGGDIRLRGAATGTADLTITASGTLTIENDINIGANALTLRSGGAIGNGGNVGEDRPTLTASRVSFTQDAAFGARPFNFDFGSTDGSLEIITTVNQDVLNWMIDENTNLTVESSARVRVTDAIGGSGNRNLGTGNLSLTSTGGTVRIMADITTTGSITLIGGTGGINFNGGTRKTLSGGNVTLSGNARSDRRLTLDATNSGGFLTLSGEINTGTSALSLNGGGTDGIALDGSLTLTGGSITIMDAVTGGENLTILTITADTLTLTRNIILTGTTSIIDLRSRQGAITGGVVLRAPTVRLRQVDVFGGTQSPFDFTTTPSLELTTTVNQDVQDWMIAPDRNLTVTSARNVFVRSAIGALVVDRNLGAGSLTLTSERRVRILEDIATTGNIILTGVASSDQPAIRFENGARVVMGGSVRLNGSAGVLTSGSSVTLTATATDGILTLTGSVNTRFIDADGATTFGDLILTGATIQIARVASAPVNTRILLRGQNITLTSANGIELGRFNRVGDFLRNNDVASLTVNAQSALTIAADITAADDTRSGGDIRLRGAATGTADLTITASGTLTIENDITLTGDGLTLALSGAGAIGNGGSVGEDRPTLTASTVSFRQVAAFGARLFNFDGTPSVGSLVFDTDAEQVVHNWMIREDTNLIVTSARNVRVEAAIGSGNRDLGAGNLTLTSTGRVVRILADISTTGNLILSGVTGGINFNGGARILNGAIITLTGAARSNRDLTLTATGVLTISNNIDIGTRALTLTGASFTFGSSVDLTAGSHSFTPSRPCDGSTAPICTDTTP